METYCLTPVPKREKIPWYYSTAIMWYMSTKVTSKLKSAFVGSAVQVIITLLLPCPKHNRLPMYL